MLKQPLGIFFFDIVSDPKRPMRQSKNVLERDQCGSTKLKASHTAISRVHRSLPNPTGLDVALI